jgi:hypothetical protein
MKAILARDLDRRRRVMKAAANRHRALTVKAIRMLCEGNPEQAEAYDVAMRREENVVCQIISEIFALGG